MKTTVLTNELKLSEVRPNAFAEKYLQLRKSEALHLLQDSSVRWEGRASPCPKEEVSSIFIADGINYHLSVPCGSIFASPVPSQDTLDQLARDGAALAYRREHYARQFSKSQRKAIHAPLTRWLAEIVDENLLSNFSYAHIGNDEAGSMSAIVEQIKPLRAVAIGQLSGQKLSDEVEISSLEDAPADTFDLLLDNGSLERVAAPEKRIALWKKILKPGGFAAITTNTASGLEYRLLGSDAPSFAPLDRLTLYSMQGLRRALEDAGLRIVEMSTPGRLDVELLTNYFEDNAPENELNFWAHALKHGSDEMKADLQQFLQRHRLCSFARVIIQKKLLPSNP